MQLLTLRIPEIEHLSVTDRQEILQRCRISEEMRRYKRAVTLICGMLPVAIAFGFFYMALFRWQWSFFPAFATFAAIAVVSIVFLLVAKVVVEIWILRRLIRRELRK